MTERWCQYQDGKIVRASGPLPYFYTDPNGDLVESRAVPPAKLRADGWRQVTIVGRPFDPTVEMETAPVFTDKGGLPRELRQFEPRPDAMEAMVARVEREFDAIRSGGELPGKQALYDLKLAEARAYLTTASVEFPLLEASLGHHGDTLDAVARAVVAAHEEYLSRVAWSERERLALLAAIRGAETIEAAIRVFYAAYPPPEETR